MRFQKDPDTYRRGLSENYCIHTAAVKPAYSKPGQLSTNHSQFLAIASSVFIPRTGVMFLFSFKNLPDLNASSKPLFKEVNKVY